MVGMSWDEVLTIGKYISCVLRVGEAHLKLFHIAKSRQAF